MNSTTRILFFAETVTLAHLARPVALAKGLQSDRYDIVMACDARYRRFLAHESWEAVSLHSISSQQFLRALATGSPVYDIATLRSYVREDLQLIEQIKPDLIVGDFRLSLSVSARLAGIPYMTITNTYWSPCYAVREFPLPVLPITRFFPLSFAGVLFNIVRPLVFSLHCKPLNKVRKEYGLASLGTDLRDIYTDADYTLYADVPEQFPTLDAPSTHHYLGPILWTPPVAKPAWWDDVPTNRPIIYVTMGSSGQTRLLPVVLDALADLPVTVIAATAGSPLPTRIPSNVYIAEYLPGTDAAARAKLVICNGGSPTSQQALMAGVPVLGIASNMDQFMNMRAVIDAGAGILLRADRLNTRNVAEAVMKMLSAPDYCDGAEKLAAIFSHYNAQERFNGIVHQLEEHRL